MDRASRPPTYAEYKRSLVNDSLPSAGKRPILPRRNQSSGRLNNSKHRPSTISIVSQDGSQRTAKSKRYLHIRKPTISDPVRNVKNVKYTLAQFDNSRTNRRSVLHVPRKIRLLIWKYLDFAALLALRLTCQILKIDVDDYVGVKVELDENDESFSSLISIGIQHATILDLPSINGKFLKHPELLLDLNLIGAIRQAAFHTVLKDCRHITVFSIEFNKDLFHMKPKLFPVPLAGSGVRTIFPHLQTLEFVANTKSDAELKYVKATLYSLIHQHLLRKVHPHTLRVTIVHKMFSEVVEECSQLMSVLVHDNCRVLRVLELDIRCLHQLVLSEEFLSGTNEDEDVLLNFFDADNDKDSDQPDWDNFPKLATLHLSLNLSAYKCYWNNICEKTSTVSSFYCEIPSPTSWLIYTRFIANNQENLVAVELVDAYNYGVNHQALQLDFKVFRRCKYLKTLYISQKKHAQLENSTIINLSKLPKTIQHVQFTWLFVSPFQVFRLMQRPQLTHMRLAYSSRTDFSFGRLLWLLKWAYPCGCVSISELIIVDLKIRFQNNKKLLHVLRRNTFQFYGQYVDYNETVLMLRRTSN